MRCGGPELCSECAADAYRARAALAQPSPCKSQVAEALRVADWSNTCIGNKALILAAIEQLEAQPSPAQAEQAEAERPEMSSERAAYFMRRFKAEEKMLGPNEQAAVDYVLSLIAQHERIVGALTATRNRYGVDAHYFNKNLQRILRDFESFTPDELARSLIILAKVADEKVVAQHSVPEEFIGRLSEFLAQRGATGKALLRELRDMLAAAPGTEVPQAWLDVQAERRRQVTAEGWTPEHDDAHSYGQMARAAACYALAGSSAPNDGTAALLVSLAWPWDEQWWKPTSARRDLVKACALVLAEIERLDRAASPGKEVGHE